LELPIKPSAANQPNDMDLMFADLYQYYMEEHQQQIQQQINGRHVINNNVDQQQQQIPRFYYTRKNHLVVFIKKMGTSTAHSLGGR
jgi:hypothetical protein